MNDMADGRKPIHEGYRPEKLEKGYQPSKPPSNGSGIQGGYQPTVSTGENPTNTPKPPPKEK